MKTNIIHNMDIRDGLLLLDDKSIDMSITSPPYWGLRDYGEDTVSIWDGDSICEHEWDEYIRDSNKYDRKPTTGTSGKQAIKDSTNYSFIPDRTQGICHKCGAWRGQLGLEPTPDLYIKHLCDIYDGIKRVLKDTGTAWVNLGDTYSQSGGAGSQYDKFMSKNRLDGFKKYDGHKVEDLPPKCLCMIPFRFALEMVNRGWILRNTIIWHRPNAMPSSVKDRFTVDFEYLFFFSKKPKYYFEQQFEPLASTTIERVKHKFNPSKSSGFAGLSNIQQTSYGEKIKRGEVRGRNMRTTWSIPTKNFKGAHFATFPSTLIETPIKSGCPEFICQKCEKPRTQIRKSTRIREDEEEIAKIINLRGGKYTGEEFQTQSTGETHRDLSPDGKTRGMYDKTEITGLSDCGCGEGFVPGIVLDPFGGAGTTAIVAKKLNRRYILFEISPEYVRLAEERLKNEEEN